ncbi:galactose-3-O-sulfotransferase 2-like [Brienomyrus brachyistius]|uniref:galactose-3-O-sulfotransferase 2-like n=1 Tax=Brienomyrus brachyistius TaxID=42636 RepID=UPI0020B18B35|nr:galactose-3-O-sulfotransferase 2-like [Brienomyrus brachyistius]
MVSSKRKPDKVQGVFFWSSIPPLIRWLKGRLWTRLRFVWLGLMFLTLFCVTFQFLGVVSQSRNSITLNEFFNKNFFNMKFPFNKKFPFSLNWSDGALVAGQSGTVNGEASTRLATRPAMEWWASCQPKSHIFFLKTHKTASSTIQNILYRYGDSRNLTFALPSNKQNQLGYPEMFSANFVQGLRSVPEYHIMCNHLRFMPHEVKKVMPADTFYFSILRNPVSMMESIFMYYKAEIFQTVNSLDEFLADPWKFYNTSLSSSYYAKNLLAFDFGFNETTQAQLAISMIEKNFNLILLSDYFDESMILLKNDLCWTLEDVVSFKINSRNNDSRKLLSPDTIDKIKVWNSLDWKIYLHFNATFWRKVDMMGGRERMKQEVAMLKQKREELMKTCLLEGGAVDPSHVKEQDMTPFQYGAAVIQGYNLKSELEGPMRKQCLDLIMPELQYTAALYEKQFPSFPSNGNLTL